MTVHKLQTRNFFVVTEKLVDCIFSYTWWKWLYNSIVYVIHALYLTFWIKYNQSFLYQTTLKFDQLLKCHYKRWRIIHCNTYIIHLWRRLNTFDTKVSLWKCWDGPLRRFLRRRSPSEKAGRGHWTKNSNRLAHLRRLHHARKSSLVCAEPETTTIGCAS